MGRSRSGARLVLADGVVPLRPAEAVFEAMLDGWAAQQRSRPLAPGTIEAWVQVVRRFATFTDSRPWQWSPADVEDWASDLLSRPVGAPAHSTVRGYQNTLALFCDYLIDPRYDWAEQCEARFGTHPVQILHEWNRARHTTPYEGRPQMRALTRAGCRRCSTRGPVRSPCGHLARRRTGANASNGATASMTRCAAAQEIAEQ